ncbi:MAG: hypothetical protein ACYSTX_05710 [Planctomycetota bacterium]|jgi:hypothetical protein
MHGWRSKIVFLLVVYFAGFVTGIYCLTPVPETQSNQDTQGGFVHSVIKSDEFAKSLNSGVHKCIAFSKDAAERAGEYIKEKMHSYDSDS